LGGPLRKILDETWWAGKFEALAAEIEGGTLNRTYDRLARVITVRIVVIGGSGHVGSFLVPRLVRAGHEVVNLTRGARAPYVDDDAWSEVGQIRVDRAAEDAAGTFGKRVAGLEAEVVVDMICFTPESAEALVEALRGRSGHLVHCGTIWRYGPSVKQPMREDDTSPPFGDYGIQKAAIAELLAAETRSGGLVTTVLQPGHISGPGWPPIGPLGNLDPDVWYAVSADQEVAIPGVGAELMHHVHADDVAQAFQLAIEQRDAAVAQPVRLDREGPHAARLRPGLRTRGRGAGRYPLADRPRSAQGRQPPDRLADPGPQGC
jgi:nucleoside-diphosphate-sugar epimerase